MVHYQDTNNTPRPMPSIFRTDNKTKALLNQFERDMPKQFQYAAAGVINAQAFQAREAIIDTIDKEMEVRSPRFVARQVRVTKADPRHPISRQNALAGSVHAKRFSGWSEQQTGKKSKKDQNLVISGARDGSYGNKVPDAFRLKEGRVFARQENYASKYARNKRARTIAMTRAAKSGKLQRPFIIEKDLPGTLSRFKYGLYTIIGGKTTRVQNFEDDMGSSRLDWMGMSLGRLGKKFSPGREWRSQMQRRRKNVRR